MALADICRDDLLPVASTLAQEAELCAVIAKEVASGWDNETNNLVAYTMASGIAQILHSQRAILLEVLNAEMAKKQQTAAIQ